MRGAESFKGEIMHKGGNIEYINRLRELIKSRAVIFGERTLASGKTSNYYIDGKLITFDPEGLYLTGKIIFDMLKDDRIDAVGGLALGAVPIVSAVAVVSYIEGRPLKSFAVRAKQKDHGTEKMVEGVVRKGWNTAIVDDVVTTGGSSFKAIEEAERQGAVVKKVIAIVDRQQGAREAFARRNYQFESILTKEDLGL